MTYNMFVFLVELFVSILLGERGSVDVNWCILAYPDTAFFSKIKFNQSKILRIRLRNRNECQK